ncbi:Putative RING-H2 finger protein ATL12 [Linum perenne]
MTVIGFAMSSLFIVFVCTRLVCARIHLNASRRSSFPIASRTTFIVSSEKRPKGNDKSVLGHLNPSFYAKTLHLCSVCGRCMVCLAEYHHGDILRILPYCGHYFHMTCIDTWFQQHATCPVCRISLHEFPDRQRTMQPLFSSAIRSQDSTIEGYDVHSYSCLFTRHGFPSRHNDTTNSYVESNNNESHQTSEFDEPKTGNSLSSAAVVPEQDYESKDLVNNKKHVEKESPSNS